MKIYDGSGDKKALPTKHTVSVVSANRIAQRKNDCMTIRKNGREDWSLFFCESGRIFFEGEVVESGNNWIYPPEVPQKYLTRSKDGTAYSYLHFTGSDIEKILDTLGIKVCVPIKSKNNSLIMKAFDSIRAAMCDTGALSKLTAEYQSLFLISLIAKNQKRTINSGIMKRVTDDMEHSFAEK